MTVDPDQRVIPRSLWEDVPEPTQVLADGDRIEGCDLIVIHTPGHTPGSICLYQETQELLFSGDTLFAGTIGRTDLPYSDPRAIIPSIRERLFPLRDTNVVYPCHGASTTIGREKKNPWFLD
jgi:glyoxylase-like metal-dependent hydrolase (beta-lactamase superfamily II)